MIYILISFIMTDVIHKALLIGLYMLSCKSVSRGCLLTKLALKVSDSKMSDLVFFVIHLTHLKL